MDVPKLIVLVQNYPELYDMRHPEYFNNVRRDNCWEEIGGIMNEQGPVCKDRWTKVRDNHRKALQRRKTKSGQAASNQKPPKYEKELQFLIPYITDEDNRESNFTPSESASESVSVNLHDDNEDELPDLDESLSPGRPQTTSTTSSLMNRPHSSTSTTSTSSTQRNAPYVYKKRNRSGVPTERSAATVLDEYLNNKRVPAQVEVAEDPLNSFFMTMAKTVKGFPIRDQIYVKQAVFNLITDKEIDIASREYSSGQVVAPPQTEMVPSVTKSTSSHRHSSSGYHAPPQTDIQPVAKSTSLLTPLQQVFQSNPFDNQAFQSYNNCNM